MVIGRDGSSWEISIDLGRPDLAMIWESRDIAICITDFLGDFVFTQITIAII